MRIDEGHDVWLSARTARHRVRVGALATAVAAALVGCSVAGGPGGEAGAADPSSAPSTAAPTATGDAGAATDSSTSAAGPTTAVTDPSSWATYRSERYDLTVGYPPGWTVEPAVRDWTWEQDARTPTPEGMEGFSSPEGDIFVTVFSVPFDQEKETREDVLAWAQDYCEAGTEPCTDLEDRALELCVEKRDCHPGLLVPFATDVQAFFTGGHYNGQLVVASVWRNDSNITVQQRYGSFQTLLEGFLATMDVWPAPTGASR
ncbi:hypothetical protein SAMN05421879_10577 [Ornithinimicrobium cerasi]|uniref:Uncharacterized protein n=2 Tax=Ornithinimicrobium cerasi TaxID=2248773 RepID=A0A285VMY1_9MICO|nr:hypothetical protein SAMN05421879_10577 [Ornithinimicrobium cerasi]